MVQNDFYDQSNVYNLYGYILHKLNKDDEALGFFRKALDLKEQGNISSVMNSYLGYAEILMEHHQYDRAVWMLKASKAQNSIGKPAAEEIGRASCRERVFRAV